jgi:YHS domain-containing protein
MHRLLALLGLFSLSGLLASAAVVVNADPYSNIALQAYDPVAFFTDSRPVKGSPFIAAEHAGHTYLFASEEHKAEFERRPEKYLPAYGGYCAFGVSIGKFFPVEIDTWEIIDGRLVLQFSQDIKRMFAEDKAANLRKADTNWPRLVARETK